MRLPIVFMLLLATVRLHAQVAVFTSGEEGHKSYRIPAIIHAPNGDLLAFAEGRVHGSGDYGDVNIVMKRSTDNGKTWSSLSTVVDYDVLQAGNPAPVVDVSDPAYPKDRIFMFYNTGNNHEGEIRKRNGLREVWYKTSTDNGHTWSEAVNITAQTHRPNQPNLNPEYRFSEDWRSYANTPGHSLQIQKGPYKGRIYVAANHSSGNPKNDFIDYDAHGFYTDDHGKTFKLSKNLDFPGSNEATAAEISNGGLLFNARNQKGDVRQRIAAWSSDGGATWDAIRFDPNLPDPVCQGSILSIGTKKRKSVLAFINAADTKYRDNLTLRISFDEGKSWPVATVVDKSPTTPPRDYTAYSDIVKTGKKKIGVLYEKENYSQIVYKVMKW